MEDERWHPWLDAMKAGNPHECGEVNRTRHGNDWRCTLPKGHLGRCERTAEFASWSVRAARIERLEQARDAARKGVA